MSLAYAAPEFFEGITHQQSDQFSLAVSYCQLRGNRLPFRATMPQMLIQQITGGTPDLTMLAEAEREAVARALHRDPARRWPTCRAFAQAIGACLPLLGAAGVATQPLPVKAPPPTAPPTPVPTPPPTPAPPPAAPTHGAERRETSKPPAAPAEPPPPPPKLVPVAPSASVPPVRTTGTAPSGPGVKPSDPNKIALLDKAIRAAVRANDLVGLREKVVALIRLQPGRADLRALLARLLYTNSLGMKLALIPAGQFTMGAPADEPGRQADEGPPYPVRITRPFYLGIAPVLQREYEALMGVNPASFFRTNGGGPDHPVEQVSWKDAVAFCQRLSEQEEEHKAGWVYRLPTEAEWEYACRAGTATAFAFGRALTADQANFDSTRPWEGTIPKPPAGRTTRVGSYPANGYGLYDVHGNVWEWCQDWYDPRAYDAGPRADPPGPAKGSAKVLRGGSWRDPAINCRCASRRSLPPTVPVRDVGFRVVAEQSDVILDFVP
jgi:formylglycine-generating enzyme required for sulfatase activity